MVYDVEGIRRITEKAFEYAYKRRKKLTLVDKANVLATSRLWRESVTAYAKDHPERMRWMTGWDICGRKQLAPGLWPELFDCWNHRRLDMIDCFAGAAGKHV